MYEYKIHDGSRLVGILKVSALSLLGRVYKEARPDVRNILRIYGSVELFSTHLRVMQREDWSLSKGESELTERFSRAVGGSYRPEDWSITEFGTEFTCHGVDAVLIAERITDYRDAQSKTNGYGYTIVVDEPEDIDGMRYMRCALRLAGYPTSIEVKSEKHNWLDSSDLILE